MDKSHVAIEQHQCRVCFNTFDTGGILLHKRLHQTLNPTEVTGWGVCPVCEQKRTDGYVALIECDERTRRPLGRTIHIKEAIWSNIFTAPCPESKICMGPSEVIDMLVAKAKADGAF